MSNNSLEKKIEELQNNNILLNSKIEILKM